MAATRIFMDQRLAPARFPRASAYHPDWILASVSGGANPLWLTEWLAEKLDLRPGMRVLDLGCGRAMSSVFLHREYGVQVWATDLWFSAAETLQRVRDAGVEGGVFPIHADARALPFAPGFFDAIVSVDSFVHYGTDAEYLGYLARFLKPEGVLGMVGSGLTKELDDGLPGHLQAWWTPELWNFHSPGWWRRHWERSGLVDVTTADTLADGWRFWVDWHRVVAPDNAVEIAALEADQGEYLGYVRVVARLRADAQLREPLVSVPTQYVKRPLLRGDV